MNEQYILVPTEIAARAKELHSKGLYENALELLQRNMVKYEIIAGVMVKASTSLDNSSNKVGAIVQQYSHRTNRTHRRK